MKTVIEMAIEAELIGNEAGMCCWIEDTNLKPYIERFAELVRADEREACAKLVEPDEEHRRDASWGYLGGTEGVELLDGMAAAIRARSNT